MGYHAPLISNFLPASVMHWLQIHENEIPYNPDYIRSPWPLAWPWLDHQGRDRNSREEENGGLWFWQNRELLKMEGQMHYLDDLNEPGPHSSSNFSPLTRVPVQGFFMSSLDNVSLWAKTVKFYTKECRCSSQF